MKIISCRDVGEYYMVAAIDRNGRITHTTVSKHDKSSLLEECLKFLEMREKMVNLLENKD